MIVSNKMPIGYGPPSGPNAPIYSVPNFWQDFLSPLEAAKIHNEELLNSILEMDNNNDHE